MKENVMKESMGDQRPSGGMWGLRRFAVLGAVFAVLVTGACGSSETAKPAVLAEDQYLENAADFVDAADWDAAKTLRIELGEMFFKPKNISVEAGKPYVLELVNTGKVKHEFSAAKFFRSVATRKVESDSSEVKVPFFTEVEVLAGKTAK